MIIGLKTSNLKIYKALSYAFDNTMADKLISKPVSFSFSLKASASPAISGLYDICFTPVGFTWKSSDRFYVEAVLNGTSSVDNGVFFRTFEFTLKKNEVAV